MSVRHTLLGDREVSEPRALRFRTVAIILTQAAAAVTGVGLAKTQKPLWVGGIIAFLVALLLVVIAARKAGWRIHLLRGVYLFSDFAVNVAGVTLAVALDLFLDEHAGHSQSWSLFAAGVPALLVSAWLRAASEGWAETQESGHRSNT